MILEFISVLNQTKSVIWEDVPPQELCMALHGNHDEHRCNRKPGHAHEDLPGDSLERFHECYCGVVW